MGRSQCAAGRSRQAARRTQSIYGIFEPMAAARCNDWRTVVATDEPTAGRPIRRPDLPRKIASGFQKETIKVSLMVMGAKGGVWAVNFWMPTYLRTVRHLSASGTGLYVAVQACGALIGFLIGAYLADAIGRKWTFRTSAAVRPRPSDRNHRDGRAHRPLR
jgi:hypothetical protein